MRRYSFFSLVNIFVLYGLLLYIQGELRVQAPKPSGDSLHFLYGTSASQVQSQVLPFQYAGKQQRDTRSSTNHIVGWIYFPADILEKRYAVIFAGYTTAYRNILVRFRKSDLIFPFHYFW